MKPGTYTQTCERKRGDDSPLWLKSLLSGIEFLHIRGVVQNDIE